MHENALLVSGAGGLGPLMALAAMRLRPLDFRLHHLDIPRSGPCISYFRPDWARVFVFSLAAACSSTCR